MIHRIEIIGDVTASGWDDDKWKYDTRKCKITLSPVEDSRLLNLLQIDDFEEIKDNEAHS